MRVSRSNSATATLVAWLVPLVSSISVPTGKLTPITLARPTPRSINPLAPANPAPVAEYTQDHPEPPPLDPSYVPIPFNYFDTLARHHVYYVPVRYRNFNGLSNHVGYEPPKYLGQTLGKNIAYKPFKQPLYWGNQYNNQNTGHRYNRQYNSQENEIDDGQHYDTYNSQANQYNDQANSQHSYQYINNQVSNQNNLGHLQPPHHQQQLQYEASSTLTPSTSSTAAPTPQAKIDYTTGKGTYDVTGKGGSRSEYYSKEDWSKRANPKKALGQGRKYLSQKY